MKKITSLMFLAVALALIALPARASSIALTGHDDDFHCAVGDANACAQLSVLVNFIKNGSNLPLLTFDAGSELTSDLTKLGISFTNINPNLPGAVTASLFNASLYSGFVVASDSSCGGCDNSPTGEAAIAAQSAAIDAFLNNGGGILGLAGGFSSGYYDFVPQTASSVGGAASSGYSQTSVGASLGIPAVNGDATHNLFFNPGTNGESSAYQIAEINELSGNGAIAAPAAVTLVCAGCTVSGSGTIVSGAVPEPSTLALLGTGVVGILASARRRLMA